MARLTLFVQDREVRTFTLSAAVTTIGRAPDNDIVINDLALSRRHAEVHQRGGGGFEIVDRGSQNGVFVEGRRIDGSRVLVDDDEILLGSYRFVFVEERSAPPSTPRGEVEPEEPTPPPVPIDARPPPPRPEPGSGPMVVLTYNGLELQRFGLERDACVIGRAKDCDVQIAERRLSRRHCSIFRDEDGRWSVEDLGSQNGTYVNRRRVREPQLLRHGDVLNFAEYAVTFTDSTETPSSDRLDRSGGLDPMIREPPRPSPAEPRRAGTSTSRSRRAVASPEDGGEEVEVRGLGQSDHFEPVDVPDPRGDRPRPDPDLDEWYRAREAEGREEEPSVLLERSPSSVSQVLSTMMVDKKELDRNFEVQRRRRRFSVSVRWGSERLFEGALERDVTVLGADPESDLPLRGRYVAGRHSLLVKVRDSLLLVRLGSSSAARVNGLPRLQAFLKAGDVIQIDETTIHVSEA